MDRISHLLGAGRVAEAEDFCREFLEAHPDDINVLGVLGAILLKQRKLDDAESILRRTIELAPKFARPHEDLGFLFMSREEPEQALPWLEKAVELDPQRAPAHHALAHALARCGRRDEAEAAHKAYLDLSPAAQTLAHAAALIEDNESQQAEQMCQELLGREPENVEALRLLARIATDDDRHVIAEGLLRRILKIAPDSFTHHMDLARFLAERNRFPEVAEVCDQAIALDPDDADAYLFKGDALSVIGRAQDALEAYERCLSIDDAHPQALVGRGQLLRVTGDRDGAIATLEKCIGMRPNIGDAWWSLASLKDYVFSDEQHKRMLDVVDGQDLDAGNEAFFRFALSRSFENRSDFAAAWEELSKGNSLKRSLVSYDPVDNETQHDNSIEVFTEEFLSKERERMPSPATPIFILGMPRSGSTLIEQILASHSQVEGTGELPYIVMITNSLSARRDDMQRYPAVLTEMDDRKLGSMGLSYLHHASSHRQEQTPFFTDKMPANFSHAGFISLILPEARIIDTRREPLATCVANYRQLYASGKNHAYDLEELGEYYLQYIRMMEHWDTVMPGRILTVHYEDVVQDLEGQVRRILDYCGLPFEDACLQFHRSERAVNTASSEQVRQPIYKDAVSFWKHYEPYLDELIEILEPLLPDSR